MKKASRISGSVAATRRIAVSRGRIEVVNGRASRYPIVPTIAAPGALFEYSRPSIIARSSNRDPSIGATCESSVV